MTRRMFAIAAPVLLLVGIGLPAAAAPGDGVVGPVVGGVLPPLSECYTVTIADGPNVTVCRP